MFKTGQYFTASSSVPPEQRGLFHKTGWQQRIGIDPGVYFKVDEIHSTGSYHRKTWYFRLAYSRLHQHSASQRESASRFLSAIFSQKSQKALRFFLNQASSYLPFFEELLKNSPSLQLKGFLERMRSKANQGISLGEAA
jgi:hypothetical protein